MYLSGAYLGFSNFKHTPIEQYYTNVFNYIDYSAQSNKNYIYYMFPETDNEIGLAMKSEPVTPLFFNDSLVNADGSGNTYQFSLNVQSGDYQNTEDFFEYNSYGKYNSFAIGKRQFYKLTISALANPNILQDSNGELSNVDYLENLRNFIQNGKQKFYKSKSGFIFSGITHNYSQKLLDDAICINNTQPYMITFEFIQTQETNDNTINSTDVNIVSKLSE